MRIAPAICSVHVPGIPQQQGSKTAFALPVTLWSLPYVPFVVRGKTVMKDANETKLKAWRDLVAGYATEYMAQEETERVESGHPVRISAYFEFPRLKSHFKSDGVTLREGRDFYKHTNPDLDKLQRAIGDALTGVCYKDDSQIASWDTRKMYGSRPGVHLYVYALPL